MTIPHSKPNILEVTLRDGSYVIDFQFSAEDTARLVAGLEAVGFRWIEIGHGLGLNAADKGKRLPADTDEAHLEAAASAANLAKWGSFFIPGIGRAQDLHMAARYHMDFVRIGTNINQFEQARPFIELGKKLGMMVCYNAMKSYAISASEFGKIAAQVHAWGADVVYVVDSAGTMYPTEVQEFFAAISGESDTATGFHGHDNLSLSMANTLQAIDSGATFVDSSLRGIGRSAGNTNTEALVAILKRQGHLPEIDLKGMTDISAGLVAPLIPGRGMDTIAIVGGYAGFHSSFTSQVQNYAEHYGIDVRDLIIRLCEENRIEAPDELLARLGTELAHVKQPASLAIPAFVRTEQPTISVADQCSRIYAEAVKSNNFSVLNIVFGYVPGMPLVVYRNIYVNGAYAISSIQVTDVQQLRHVLQEADGNVDIILLDVNVKSYLAEAPTHIARQVIQKSLLLTYSQSGVWVDAIQEQIVRLCDEHLPGKVITIWGDNPRSRKLASQLQEIGGRVRVLVDAVPQDADDIIASSAQGHSQISQSDFVVLWRDSTTGYDDDLLNAIPSGCYLLDAKTDSLPTTTVEKARARGVLTIRVSIWPALAGRLASAHESAHLYRGAMGWKELAGIPIVAGGAVGGTGAIVVDDINQPTRIIGVADGRGGLIAEIQQQHLEHIQRVQEEINRVSIMPRQALRQVIVNK